MGASAWLCAFGSCTILGARASACFCLSTPMCAQIGRLSESSAVFVGRVTSVWPTRQTIANESKRLTLVKLRQLVLTRWGGALTSEEKRYVRVATDRDALEVRFGHIQRVQFTVSEFLGGPQIREVFT